MNTSEIWIPIQKTDGLYEVSNFGQIRNSKTKRIRKLRNNRKGYPQANNVCGYTLIVHREVTHAFIGPCPIGLQVNHKDGNKMNNHVSNLEYASPGKNMKHAYEMGLKTRMIGELNPRAKVTESDVIEIRRLLDVGLTQKEISELFSVGIHIISYIKTRRTWAHI